MLFEKCAKTSSPNLLYHYFGHAFVGNTLSETVKLTNMYKGTSNAEVVGEKQEETKDRLTR
jgi:hypothetical protein